MVVWWREVFMRTVKRIQVATIPHTIESTTVSAGGGLLGYWSRREGEAEAKRELDRVVVGFVSGGRGGSFGRGGFVDIIREDGERTDAFSLSSLWKPNRVDAA